MKRDHLSEMSKNNMDEIKVSEDDHENSIIEEHK